jgi:dTDP-4-dehydrorhamnose 3,5-epimerase
MTEIDGVELLELEVFGDDRGAFIETYRGEWLKGAREMVQSNLSRSKAGVLRGLHFHRRQADYWFVVEGRAFVVLFDVRAGSPTEDVAVELRLDADSPRGLLIPAGVAHGFFAESDVVLQYLVDEVFDGSDEFGVAWDDPDVAIAWPSRTPILSARDASNPPLEGLERPLYGSTSP